MRMTEHDIRYILGEKGAKRRVNGKENGKKKGRRRRWKRRKGEKVEEKGKIMGMRPKAISKT